MASLRPGWLPVDRACRQSASSADRRPPALAGLLQLKGDPEKGKAIFPACQDCHRKDASGRANGVFPRLAAAQHYRYLLREVLSIRDGERGNSDPEMVEKVKPYSPTDIEAVADYMSQLPPPARK